MYSFALVFSGILYVNVASPFSTFVYNVFVTDGMATTNYTIPAKTKAKTYNLTAVFTDTAYERSETHMIFEVAKE